MNHIIKIVGIVTVLAVTLSVQDGTLTLPSGPATLAIGPKDAKIVYTYKIQVWIPNSAEPVVEYVTTTDAHFSTTFYGYNQSVEATVSLNIYGPDGTAYLISSPGTGQSVTLHSPVMATATPLVKQLSDLYNLIDSLAETFTSGAKQIITAVRTDPTGFLENLNKGLQLAATKFTAGLGGVLQKAALTWLGLNGIKASMPGLSTTDAIIDFLLQVSGLTVPNIKSMVVQALGASNAAAQTIATLLSKAPDDFAGLSTFLSQIDALITPAMDISPLTIESLGADLTGQAYSMLKSAATSAISQLVAKFVPGLGTLNAIYNGLQFLSANQGQIEGLVNQLLNSLNELGNSEKFANSLVSAMDAAIPLLLKGLASQFGLSNLPAQIQNALQFVPNKVSQFLTAVIGKLAANLKIPGGTGGNPKLFDGLMSTIDVFSYQGQTFDLWVAKVSGVATVKLALVSTAGVPTFLTVMGKNDFSNAGDITTLLTDSKMLATTLGGIKPASTSNPQTPADKAKLQKTQTQQNTVNKDLTKLKQDIQGNQCTALDSNSCFRAHMKLESIEGNKRVDRIQVGDLVAARNEFDPDGPVEWKRVVAVYKHTGRIFEAIAKGKVIGTTPEHPFYPSDRPWTAASALKPGDMLRTKTGWVTIDEIRDTGLYEEVYNVQVEDFHTYFVTDDGWDFSVWAHNACKEDYIALDSDPAHLGQYTLFNITTGQRVVNKTTGLAIWGSSFAAVYNQIKTTPVGWPGISKVISRLIDAGYGWSDYLNSLGTDALGLAKPSPLQFDMHVLNPAKYPTSTIIAGHAHHIVQEKGTATQRSDVLQAQQILRNVGIDPFFSQYNLVWAPNFSHWNANYAANVLTTLQADASNKSKIIDDLKEIARAFTNGKWDAS